jgi:hypothetical protein
MAAVKSEGMTLKRALLELEELKPMAEKAWNVGCYTPWLESIRRGLRL